jgi:sugar lactone lactonase YvrE
VKIGRLIGAMFAAAAIAACSAWTPSSLAPNSAQSVAQAAGTRFDSAGCPASVVYIVSNGNRSIEIYDASNLGAGPCGSVTGLSSPQGLFVDSKGNLWVVDAVSQQIFEFAPGKKNPAVTLSDPNGVPNDVVVDETSGTAYVTEYQNNVNPRTLVEVYPKGSTLPTGSLSDPNARNGAYDTVDNKGNLYVTFMTQDNKAQVDRWIGGAGSPQNLGLQLVSSGGIVTTASGSLAVCDPFAFRCGSFPRGSTTMSRVFGHMGRFSEGVGPDKPPFLHPDTLALDRDEHLAYVAATSLTTWKFPGPNHRPNHLPLVEIRIPGDAGQGVAVNPASPPGAPY